MRGFENFGFIIAPKSLVNRRQIVGWMYRETPETQDDSGWRVFVGDEDEAQLENDTYFALYDVKTILEIDPSIEKFLHSPECSAFERNEAGEFIAVKYDPPPEE